MKHYANPAYPLGFEPIRDAELVIIPSPRSIPYPPLKKEETAESLYKKVFEDPKKK
ncbi:MAG: hypothetical protein HUJ60_04375 [Bacilli bacterium]|mgnify:FL=1|nr:hypothetical protein [Bacilli bacterium]